MINKFIPYLPLFVVLVASLLAYLTGIRSKGIDQFNDLVKVNVKDIGGPVLRQIREIRRISDSNEKIKLLKKFIDKQGGESSQLELLGNHYIYEWFFMVEDLYYIYLKDSNLKTWEHMWASFEDFYLMFKNEHHRNRRVLFRQFGWYQKLSETNFLYRTVSELVRILYVLFNGIMVVILLSFIFVGYDKVIGYFNPEINLIPTYFLESYWTIFVLISLLFVMIWGLMLMIASCFGVMTAGKLHLEKTLLKKILSKWFPKRFGGQWDYNFNYDQKKLDHVKSRVKLPVFINPTELNDVLVGRNRVKKNRSNYRRL